MTDQTKRAEEVLRYRFRLCDERLGPPERYQGCFEYVKYEDHAAALQAEYRRGVEAMRDAVNKGMLDDLRSCDCLAARLLSKSEEGK